MQGNKKVLTDDYGVYFDDAMRDELMACTNQVKRDHINSFIGELNLFMTRCKTPRFSAGI